MRKKQILTIPAVLSNVLIGVCTVMPVYSLILYAAQDIRALPGK